MDFSDNKIEEIQPETFTNLPFVDELNLSHNRIKNIKRNSLPTSVKTINLSNNKLESFDPVVIENLPQLSSIDLKNNNIKSLPENTFARNPNLQKILLGGNKIKSLDPKTFENLLYLETVDLAENDCLSGSYGPNTFKALKSEITRLCQTGNRPETHLARPNNLYQVVPNNEDDENVGERQERVVSFNGLKIFEFIVSF